MGLKLRTSYILLVISLVVLAVGITLIIISSTPDRTTDTPTITTLVDRTVVVPYGGERRVDFNVPRTGVLRVTVEVISGGVISFSLYKSKGLELWWSGEEGHDIIRSSFEVPIDAGRYYLNLIVFQRDWWKGTFDDEERTVSVHLEFEG